MPVTAKDFYAGTKNNDSESESECRWGPRNRFKSSIVIPPSEASSSAKSALADTRFNRSLSRTKAVSGVTVTDAWQPFKPPTQLVLPAADSAKKCADWIIRCDSGRHFSFVI